jgi:hypothetical protein
MMMKKTLIAAGLLAFGVMAAAPASAGQLVTPTQERAFSLPDLDETFELFFDGFDASLGKLMSVHWTFEGTATLNNAVVNIDGPVMVGDPNPLSAIWDITFSSPVGMSDSAQLVTPDFAGEVPAGGPTQVGTSGLVGISGMAWIDNSDPVTLADYIGGAVSVLMTVSGQGTQGGSVPATPCLPATTVRHRESSLSTMTTIPPPFPSRFRSLCSAWVSQVWQRRVAASKPDLSIGQDRLAGFPVA